MHSALKPRNAFTIPARARKNAGAHTHKHPPRLRLVPEMDERACRACGELLEPDDDWTLCVGCAVEHAFKAS